tara:strand:+ start:680 stop:862 length:183 start_codon:yes stop_codon:yes gene_type:complete
MTPRIDPKPIEVIIKIEIILRMLLFGIVRCRSLKKKNRNPNIATLGIVLRNGSRFIGADS